MPGVAMNPPPLEHLPSITAAIEQATATLAPGARGGLVAIATTAGVNLAVVQKIGDRGSVVAWVGKSWGAPLAGGVAWRQTW